CEPPAPVELFLIIHHRRSPIRCLTLRYNIGQIGITDCTAAVPPSHGVYGLRKLSAAGFVDSTRINPDKVEPILDRLLRCKCDLAKTSLKAGLRQRLHVLEQYLIFAPGVREDR